MAFCPKCRKEVDLMARTCAHCGHEFGTSLVSVDQAPGWAYGKLAGLSITLSIFICWLYAGLGLFLAGYSFFHGEFRDALIALASAVLTLGISAALARTQDLK